MIRRERGIGRTSRQTNGATAEVCDIGVFLVSLNNSANVSDVMSETCHNEIRVVACRRLPQQHSSNQDVMSGKGDEHGVLQVMIQRVAVTDALQCESGRIG